MTEKEPEAMAKANRTGSKQRKTRKPDVKKNAPVVQINERQVVSDSMATSGERASDAITRISDWMQANGKVILGVIAIGLVSLVSFMVISGMEDSEADAFASQLRFAASAGADLTTDDLPSSVENQQKELEKRKRQAIIDAFEGDVQPLIDFTAAESGNATAGKRAADYYYLFATALFARAQSDRNFEGEARTQVEDKVIEQVDSYAELIANNEGIDPESKLRLPHLTNIKETQILARREFLKDPVSVFSKESEFTPGPTEPKLVSIDEGGGYPTIGFLTSKGTFKFELYEGEPFASYAEVIKLIVTAIERGYYNETTPGTVAKPGLGSLNDTKYPNMHFITFGERGRLIPLPKDDADAMDDPLAQFVEQKDKEETGDEHGDSEPDKEVMEPYFVTQAREVDNFGAKFSNTEGAIFQFYAPDKLLKRGPAFGVNLKDNSHADGRYQVIGRITEGLDVVKSLRTSDKIYKTWIEQLRDGSNYLPEVIFIQGPDESMIPRLWTEDALEYVKPELPKPSEIEIVEDENPLVWMRTEKGDILIELFEDETPNTVENFVMLVNSGWYTDVPFHRVEPFSGGKGLRIAQGGRRGGSEDFLWTIRNEAKERGSRYNLKNVTGTLAMARQTGLDTAGCQFFLNLQANEGWDRESSLYTVFGRVVKNLSAMERLRPDDKILEARVVRVRRDVSEYMPKVKPKGEAEYQDADLDDLKKKIKDTKDGSENAS